MKDLKVQPFYEKLNSKFKKKLPDLITQSKVIFFYDKLEFGAYLFAGGLILLNAKELLSGNLSTNSFLMILTGGLAILLVNTISKEPRSHFKKSTEKMKNTLIAKVCDCPDYCNCKDEFISYMKKRNIDFLK